MKRLFFWCILLAVLFLRVTLLQAAQIKVMPTTINAVLSPNGSYNAIIYIVDADGSTTDFTWQLLPDRRWIQPETVSGQGPAAVKITITAEAPEETVGAISIYSDIGESSVTVHRSIVEETSPEFFFTLNPYSVSVEITRVPGTGEDPSTFEVGVSCENPPEGDIPCAVSTNVSWLGVEKDSGGEGEISCGSSFTVSVNTAGLPEGNYNGEVSVSCGGITQNVEVWLVVEEVIADQLNLSPTNLSYYVSMGRLLPRTFSVKLANANPEGRGFSWRAEAEAPWLKVEPSSGSSASSRGVTISVTVDPLDLPAGTYEGKVRFFSDLDEVSATEGLVLTVNLEIFPWQTLGVFPGSLFWSIEKTEEGLVSGPLSPQRLHIFTASGSWSAEVDVPWLELSSLWPGGGETPEGLLEVAPLGDFVAILPYGRYEGHIHLIDRPSGLFRIVPVVLEIRRPGEEILLPVPPPNFSQLAPDFVRVEAVEAGILTLKLPATKDPPDEANHYTYSSRLYFTLENPSLWPGKVFVWRPLEGRFISVEENGIPVSGADDLYTTLGPLSTFDFGPVELKGLAGEFFFELKAGPSYQQADTLQRVILEIYTPAGAWRITDIYHGQPYIHPESLVFWREGNGWAACWKDDKQCLIPVQVYYGDGQTNFYRLEFSARQFWFQYEIKKLSSTEMKGRWRFFNGEEWSAWEKFQGTRLVFKEDIKMKF